MRLDRLEKLIGKSKLNILKHSTVAIFGLGGVGSYAIESLARSGIGNLIICDYDTIDETNINRQIFALGSTIGKYKTEVAYERIKDINPETTVLAYPVKAIKEVIEDILNMNPDFVIDAIDDVDAKVNLIHEALRRDIRIISSMGFANKLHPELIKLCTLDKTSICPLAKTMRKRLKEEKITQNFPVVYSIETPIKTMGVLGSSAFVPSTAGLLLSSYVVNKIIGD